MNNHWLDEVNKHLEEESKRPSDVIFDRLRELGIINEQGEVTGHLHRWTSFLAITAVKRVTGAREIVGFRCLKPVFGMPGVATIDVSRDSMVAYLKAGKKVITARREERLDMWKEGCDVHLSPQGFIRCDDGDEKADNVGTLPEFQQSDSRL